MKQGRSLKAAKAERVAKKKRAKKRKRALVLLVEVIIFCSLVGTGYIMTKYNKFQLNPFEGDELQINEGVQQEKYTTIALFGGDSREGELEAGTHADTMMVVSIDKDTKEIRIVSIYRDLVTKQLDRKLNKANHAYYHGGPLEAINMLNQNFDLSIQDYVTVDFKAMADAVDLLGGIEVDVTDAEAEELNHYIDETAQVAGKKAKHIEGGTQALDGVQTVTYARIRKNVGDDYKRTERQRLVIEKMLEKIKQTDLSTLNEIIDTVFPQVSTSFELKELVQLATGVLQYELKETSGYPFETKNEMIKGLGSVVVSKDANQSLTELHAFLYPKEEYVISKTAKSIAQEINALSVSTEQLDNEP